VTRDEKNALVNAAWQSRYEGTRKLLLMRLAYLTRLDGDYADPSQETLAAHCSCSVRMIKYHVAALKADGVLNVELVREKSWHNRYFLQRSALARRGGNGLPLDDALLPPEGETGCPEERQSIAPGGGNGLPKRVYPERHQAEQFCSVPGESSSSQFSRSIKFSDGAIRLRDKWRIRSGDKPGNPEDFEALLRSHDEEEIERTIVWAFETSNFWPEKLANSRAFRRSFAAVNNQCRVYREKVEASASARVSSNPEAPICATCGRNRTSRAPADAWESATNGDGYYLNCDECDPASVLPEDPDGPVTIYIDPDEEY